MYILQHSPRSSKKFRITFPDQSYVDFGAKNYSDYTKHKNPVRMRSYLIRHGGNNISPLYSLNTLHEKMLEIDSSHRENWSQSGYKSSGFWSRWLLWSFPTLHDSINFIHEKFKIRVLFDE